MAGETKRFLVKSILFIDILLIINAYNFSYIFRNTYLAPSFGRMGNFAEYLWVVIAACVLIPFFMAVMKVYDNLLEDKLNFSLLRTLIGIALCMILMPAAFYFLGIKDFSRLFFGLFAACTFILLPLERLMVKIALGFYARSRMTVKNVLIIGSGNLGRLYFRKAQKYRTLGTHVVGFLRTKAGSDQSDAKEGSLPVLGEISELPRVIKERQINEVVIALSPEEYKDFQWIVPLCDKEGLRINLLPAYFEYLDVSTRIETFDGLPVMHLREVPLDSISKRVVKRTFDIVFALLAIVVFSPLYLIIPVLIKLTSEGPVFYKQERVSVENKVFNMLKFRTMRVQTQGEDKTTWTTKNDSRVTPLGAILRKTSLDEIPQFFNVLKGDMSIVGPRPERPFFVDKFKEEIPNYMHRHYIKAGITGWAQVNGLRGDTSIDERITYDNYYIANWSIWMDIKILFLTVIKGFVNVNAY